MATNEESAGVSENEYARYVPAVFARDADEAEQYRELLSDHDIPAIVGGDEENPGAPAPVAPRGPKMTHGVAILVPDVLLEEASEVIADREDVDDFQVGADEEDEDDVEDDDGVGFDGSVGDPLDLEDDAETHGVGLGREEEEEDDVWGEDLDDLDGEDLG